MFSRFAALFVICCFFSPALAGQATVPAGSSVSKCSPTPTDPCADIAPIVKFKTTNQQPSRPGKLSIENSQDLANQSDVGILPSDLAGKFGPASSRASGQRKTTLRLTNYSSFTIYWRIFAVRGGYTWAWPSATTAWTQRSRSTVTKTINCIPGETLWFGADDTTSSYYWGIGVNADETCNWDVCSSTCDGRVHTLTITN